MVAWKAASAEDGTWFVCFRNRKQLGQRIYSTAGLGPSGGLDELKPPKTWGTKDGFCWRRNQNLHQTVFLAWWTLNWTSDHISNLNPPPFRFLDFLKFCCPLTSFHTSGWEIHKMSSHGKVGKWGRSMRLAFVKAKRERYKLMTRRAGMRCQALLNEYQDDKDRCPSQKATQKLRILLSLLQESGFQKARPGPALLYLAKNKVSRQKTLSNMVLQFYKHINKTIWLWLVPCLESVWSQTI